MKFCSVKIYLQRVALSLGSNEIHMLSLKLSLAGKFVKELKKLFKRD